MQPFYSSSSRGTKPLQGGLFQQALAEENKEASSEDEEENSDSEKKKGTENMNDPENPF